MKLSKEPSQGRVTYEGIKMSEHSQQRHFGTTQCELEHSSPLVMVQEEKGLDKYAQ